MRGLRVEPVVVHADGRGSLHKLLPGPVPGEVYLVRVAPEQSRGHHRHARMGEWFTALDGEGVLGVLDPQTGAAQHLSLDGVRVWVPAGLGHALFCTGAGAFVVLALAERGHDPADVEPCVVPGPEQT